MPVAQVIAFYAALNGSWPSYPTLRHFAARCGEWHPALDAPPSFVDRRSLRRIARRRNYPTDRPVLLIVEKAPGEQRLRAYEFVVKPKKSCRELPVVRELPCGQPS
jgi:hypothetical protein